MKKMYIGVNGLAKSVNNAYIGVNGIAKKVAKIYVGDVNGVAKLAYSSSIPTTPETSFLQYTLNTDGTSYCVNGIQAGFTNPVVIPDNYNRLPITIIGNSAFKRQSNLQSITISNSVVLIDYWAFNDCNNLTTVLIGKNVTTIQGQAFSDCTNLQSIIIPASVTSIGAKALYIGSSSKDSIITVLSEVPPTIIFNSIGSYVKKIKVPASAVGTYKSATNWSKYADIIEAIEE